MPRWLGPTLTAIAAAAFFGLLAFADQLIGMGGGYWSGRLTSSTTTQIVQDVTDAATRDALFPCGQSGGPYYSSVQIVAAGAGCAGFTTIRSAASPAPDIGAGVWNNDGPYGEGGGNIRCFGSTGGEWHTRPSWWEIRAKPGGTIGICNTASANIQSGYGHTGEIRIYQPCQVDADCTSGTCRTSDWTLEQLQYVGCYLAIEAETGTPLFHIHKEKIAR